MATADMEPHHILEEVEALGARECLPRLWDRIEELHSSEAFKVEQVVQVFNLCTRYNYLGLHETGGSSLPLGTRVVQLFSNFICERIPTLSPSQLTAFIVALTSPALAMDEFWLYMMAKRVQDTTADFTADQTVTIAQRYAEKQLEDDEFFSALAGRVLSDLDEFSHRQLAVFMLSCARLRFLPPELCDTVFARFEDPVVAAVLDGHALSAAISSAAMLDRRYFRAAACCDRLAASPADFNMGMQTHDLKMGIILGLASFSQTASLKRLLPQVLGDTFSTASTGWRHKKSRTSGMNQRRVTLLSLCAAFGVPRPSAWSLDLLRNCRQTLNLLELSDSNDRKSNPSSSSFHLEVVVVLKLLEVEHKVEHSQFPFWLDLRIPPGASARPVDPF